jgi:hypothetical protein
LTGPRRQRYDDDDMLRECSKLVGFDIGVST